MGPQRLAQWAAGVAPRKLLMASVGVAMVTIAARPADGNHPYGHHKAEYFSSGFEGVLIIVAAVGIGWLAVLRLLAPEPIEAVDVGLMDEATEPEVQQKIQQVLDGFSHQPAHATVLRFDHIVTRKAGQRRFVDLHMHLPGCWTLARAAELRASVEHALMAEVPGLRATISLLPTDVEAQAVQQPH